MLTPIPLLLAMAIISFASPIEHLGARAVTALNPTAFEEAQKKDTTATRAFSSTEVLTSSGDCLFVDELSGDFRANLNPVQIGPCDGSTGQQWDVITKGVHNNVANTMLLVNTLTQACMNFDDRRLPGNRVIMFSCGGRADGGGIVTPSQLFNFTGGAGPIQFAPKSGAESDICLAVAGNVLDQAPCQAGNAGQLFTFGKSGTASGTNVASPSDNSPTATSIPSKESGAAIKTNVAAPSSPPTLSSVPSGVDAPALTSDCTSTTIISITRSRASATAGSISPSSFGVPLDVNPTTPVPVSRAGGVLKPSSAAESNPRDDTANRAFSSVSIKSSSGECLFIDPTAGDFRQNLIPVAVQPCSGTANEKFDIITAGAHNNVANTTLVVSTLTQGCVNFDNRRLPGDKVILFSCGGRADGGGTTTDSQLFKYSGGNTLILQPASVRAPEIPVCLVVSAGKLDTANCDGSQGQTFSIV